MDNPSDEAIAEALRLRGLDENLAPIFKTLRLEQSGVLHHARTIDQRNKLVEALITASKRSFILDGEENDLTQLKINLFKINCHANAALTDCGVPTPWLKGADAPISSEESDAIKGKRKQCLI